MSAAARKIVTRHLSESRDVVIAAIADDRFLETLVEISTHITACLRAGGKVLFAGNGGSAADAQHIAGEFVSRLNYDRDPVAGIALTTDSSVLTAIGNDYGYEEVFARQVRRAGQSRRHFYRYLHFRPVTKYPCCRFRCKGYRYLYSWIYRQRRYQACRSLRYRAASPFNRDPTYPTDSHYGRPRDLRIGRNHNVSEINNRAPTWRPIQRASCRIIDTGTDSEYTAAPRASVRSRQCAGSRIGPSTVKS